MDKKYKQNNSHSFHSHLNKASKNLLTNCENMCQGILIHSFNCETKFDSEPIIHYYSKTSRESSQRKNRFYMDQYIRLTIEFGKLLP